jgi:hypothetical protein
VKALNIDVRFTPQKQTFVSASGVSALGQNQTKCVAANSNYSITLSHSYCTGLGPTKNLVDNLGGASKLVRNVRSIRYHAIGSKADITLT